MIKREPSPRLVAFALFVNQGATANVAARKAGYSPTYALRQTSLLLRQAREAGMIATAEDARRGAECDQLTIDDWRRAVAPARHQQLYVIAAAGQGCYKVGVSVTPAERALQLQTGCPFPLSVVLSIQVDGVRAVEERVHALLEERCESLAGEWFRCALSDIMLAVADAVDAPEGVVSYGKL